MAQMSVGGLPINGIAGGLNTIATASVTMTTAGTYAANDFVGGSGVPITFNNCVQENGDYGMIYSVVLSDYALQSVACELWLFESSPTGLPDDNAAFTIADASTLTCAGIIPFNTYYASALNSVSVGIPSAPISFKCASDSKSIYGALVTRGAPVYASGDIKLRLNILQD